MADNQRIVEEYHPWNVEDLLHPHTLGRAFYMRPARRPGGGDREYFANELFWRDVLEERLGAERNVQLRSFRVFDWLPRNPGLYHTDEAQRARDAAQQHVRDINPQAYSDYLSADGAPPDAATGFRAATSGAGAARTIIYTPQGKLSMLRGGVGCIRLKPIHLKIGGSAWLMSATSTDAPDEGIPLLVHDNDYQELVDDLYRYGAINCDLVGRTRFVSEEFADLFSVLHGIPRLYIEVSEIKRRRLTGAPGQVSVAASFLSTFEGPPRVYASYVTFDPGRANARQGAAHWLKEEYVERLYEGTLLTDFDQRAPTFGNALFTLDQVLTSPDLAGRIAELAKLYGHFDWGRLDRFSYVAHQGDLIVTNNTITVSNSTNVVIQSTLTDAHLVAGNMSSGGDADRLELRRLLDELQKVLPTAPFDRGDQAEAVANQAKNLVEEVAKPKPNQTSLKVLGQGLRTTAEFIKDAVPSALTIVTQLLSLISRVHGLPV